MSCLFHSLHKLLADVLRAQNIPNLRIHLCEVMEKIVRGELVSSLSNRSMKEWLTDCAQEKYRKNDVSRYIKDMRKSSTWGGGMEIALTSILFSVKIVVHYKGREIVFEHSPDCSRCVHLNYTGAHYTPIMKKGEEVEEEQL